MKAAKKFAKSKTKKLKLNDFTWKSGAGHPHITKIKRT